jgi:hypothetical protein
MVMAIALHGKNTLRFNGHLQVNLVTHLQRTPAGHSDRLLSTDTCRSLSSATWMEYAPKEMAQEKP